MFDFLTRRLSSSYVADYVSRCSYWTHRQTHIFCSSSSRGNVHAGSRIDMLTCKRHLECGCRYRHFQHHHACLNPQPLPLASTVGHFYQRFADGKLLLFASS